DGGEQLVGDAEQRPQRVDAAERVAHRLNQKITPARYDQTAGEHIRLDVLYVAERSPDIPQNILQQVASDTGAGVESRKNEQRFEHDREVIPQIEPALAHGSMKYPRHSDRERGRAAGPTDQGISAAG